MASPEIRRVLLLLPGAFGEVGGIQMYNRLLIKAFSELMLERGGTCDVMVLNDPPGCFDPRYGTTATTVENFSRSKVRFVAAALRRARALRPDLIVIGHVNFGSLGLALRLVSAESAQWFIAHGVDVWKRLSAPIRLALSRAEKILSVSDYTRRELIAQNGLSGDNCELQPNALDPFWVEDYSKVAAEATFPATPQLLTCARLSVADRYKGIDCVILALPAVLRQHPQLRFRIIGDGNDRNNLEQIARDAGVSANVDFTGRASQEELAHAYADCSLFIMPSKKEGFGIVFLEAAFFGKPSIGGAHGGTPEVIEDNATGWVVEHGDPSAISELLLRILESPSKLQEVAAKARIVMMREFRYAAFQGKLARHASMERG